MTHIDLYILMNYLRFIHQDIRYSSSLKIKRINSDPWLRCLMLLNLLGYYRDLGGWSKIFIHPDLTQKRIAMQKSFDHTIEREVTEWRNQLDYCGRIEEYKNDGFYCDERRLYMNESFEIGMPSYKINSSVLTEKINSAYSFIEDIAMHSNIFIGVTSVLSRLGSFTIFLLLNDMSHDARKPCKIFRTQ